MASGILNMTRGLGTALGLALTGLLFSVSGGVSGGPAGADHAFTVTAVLLGAIAAGAGLVAALPFGSRTGQRPTSTTLGAGGGSAVAGTGADDRSGR